MKENYEGKFEISEKPNKKGKFEVASKSRVCVINKQLKQLTNNLFEFTIINWDFNCDNCPSLTSLEGSPRMIKGNFSCSGCNKLKSLEGAPKKVGGFFNCRDCGVQFTNDDVKKVSKVKKFITV